jgi:DNA-binding response OmpR family regulator
MQHLLLVEDDRNLALCVRRYLEAAGHAVTAAEDAATARELWSAHRYEAVILDLVLPDGEGLDLCRELRVQEGPAVVVTSARGDGADRMLALEAGADMYLAKPYDLDELSARIAALGRRGAGSEPPGTVACGDLWVDRGAREARVGGQALELTRKEFDLLARLAESAGRIVPASELLWEIWGYSEQVRTRTLDVHIGRLRQKLAAAGATGSAIVTKPGVGYGMEGEVESRKSAVESEEREFAASR